MAVKKSKKGTDDLQKKSSTDTGNPFSKTNKAKKTAKIKKTGKKK